MNGRDDLKAMHLGKTCRSVIGGIIFVLETLEWMPIIIVRSECIAVIWVPWYEWLKNNSFDPLVGKAGSKDVEVL